MRVVYQDMMAKIVQSNVAFLPSENIARNYVCAKSSFVTSPRGVFHQALVAELGILVTDVQTDVYIQTMGNNVKQNVSVSNLIVISSLDVTFLHILTRSMTTYTQPRRHTPPKEVLWQLLL